MEEDGDVLSLFQAASLLDIHALGPRKGRKVERGGKGEPRVRSPDEHCATFDGYNLHAGVVISARDRSGLGRLARYMLRPPLVGPRVARRSDGRVVLTLRRPWSNGTTELSFTPAELVARLVTLIPPFREHQLRYHGVFAPNAHWRAAIVPGDKVERDPKKRLTRTPRIRGVGPSWADLLRRCFGVDGWACPICAQPMQLRAVVVGQPATTRILWGLKPRGPPP